MISDERRDRFWEVICSFYGIMWLGLSLTVSMFALSLFSYAHVRSTGSSIIVQVNLVVLTLLLFGFLLPIRRCHDR